MIREIVKGEEIFTAAEDAVKDDLYIGKDLRDTLEANSDRCVGMRANMIGINKRVIIADTGDGYIVMFNPVIIRAKDAYTAEEGCLSLDGVRKTKRYRKIKVQYRNENFDVRLKTFTEYTAEIIQHEIDHTNGIVI